MTEEEKGGDIDTKMIDIEMIDPTDADADAGADPTDADVDAGADPTDADADADSNSIDVDRTNLFVERVVDKYFEDNPDSFVKHHLDSYNEFFTGGGINRIFKEKNPIRISKNHPKQDDGNVDNKNTSDYATTEEFDKQCNIWLGGKDGSKIYFGKPIIYDDERAHYMYPNEARLRNMTYAFTVHYDVEVEYFIKEQGGEHSETPLQTIMIEKVFLGRFPVMLMSDLCILKGLAPQMRFELGECKNDRGGYFIIDGKEKCIVSQEKFADNALYVRDKVNDTYSHSSEIRSVSEDPSKPVRTLQVRIVAPSTTYRNNQIVVNVPNVKKPVPLFIMMRALGIESDREIIEMCLLDMERNKELIDIFIPSIHDAGKIFNQEMALTYIGSLTKGKTLDHAFEIVSNYFLPHIGVMNFRDKAFFLGHMVKKLLGVFTKQSKPTDRDSFRFKRVELPGTLLYDLFNEYYTIQQRDIFKKIDAKYHFDKISFTDEKFTTLVTNENYRDYFSDKIVESGMKRALKGDWGGAVHTKRVGIVQDLNRLTFNSAMSHLRKVNLDMDASAKVVAPRHLHSSQWGIIDPLDTPDGGNVGLHKHMSIAASITSGTSAESIIEWLQTNKNKNKNKNKNINMRKLGDLFPRQVGGKTKVFVNGRWIGIVDNPKEAVDILKKYRRSNLIPLHTSIGWFVAENAIEIFTDSGRLCRPIFYIDNNKASYDRDSVSEYIEKNGFTWKQLVGGFAKKKRERANNIECLAVEELYGTDNVDDLKETQSVIEYLDTSESETSLISMRHDTINEKRYTHIEIHAALALGVMGNQVVFPENNPLSRNLFACGQMKQAVSLYHSNFQTRIDKMGVVLNNGQVPLVKSRFLKKINNEEHPYGENVVVAIMCYSGYNVEDSILFNEGSVKRGLFRTTYYNSYEDREDSSKVGETQVDSKFANIETESVIGLKTGFDYGELDANGLIRENTMVDENTILIGKMQTNISEPDVSTDASVSPKKGQRGFVDKTFLSDGEEGFRTAKIRVRDERIPNIGDKFCSRCGQKGTVGLVIPEESMPFAEDGTRPDIIINPHALPSRMTIGQLVETQMGKACSILGGYGDCTAFMNKGPKHEFYGKILTDSGYHSSGCQVMYNGESGEQVEANIFVGPTYYMRLKHMVKDKINYRARGPRTALTRQTVQGRANDGGLRVGEMERDCIISHGATRFLQESMLERGDDYCMAVCDLTGMVAIYNENKNLMLSPFADGPIKFSGTLDEGMSVHNITKHGRSFSVVRVPYAFKLMLQELQTMNVQMRIVTENNIDQITSMSFSNNVVKLLGNGATPQTVVEASREKLKEEEKYDGVKINPTTIGWRQNGDYQDEIVWNSLIVENEEQTGFGSDTWFNTEHDGLDPQKPPSGWNADEAVYNDGTPIPPSLISEILRKNPVPGNWKVAIDFLKQTPPSSLKAELTYGIPQPPPPSTQTTPLTPLYNQGSPSYDPTATQYIPESPLYDPDTSPYNPDISVVTDSASSSPSESSPPTSPSESSTSTPTSPSESSPPTSPSESSPPTSSSESSPPTSSPDSSSQEDEAQTLSTKMKEAEKANASLLTTIASDELSSDTDDVTTSEKKNIKLN